MNELGNRLKKVRKARRMTRKEIGEKIGMNYADTRLDGYETGKTYPRKDMIKKLADVLGVTTSWLKTGILDDETIQTFEKWEIMYIIYQPFNNPPQYYFQLTDFLSVNKSVIETCLTSSEYENITKIITDKIEEKLGTTGMLVDPVSVDEYNDYMMELEQNALDYDGDI